MNDVNEEKPARIPTISAVMTPFPWVISTDQPLSEARKLMTRHAIRHLPVVEHGKAVGVLTDRDVFIAETSDRVRKASGELKVGDVAVRDAYVVDIHEPLDKVLLEMAARHIGSALVVKEDKVAGIFTVNDACRHFGLFLRRMFPSQDGDDVA